jgi:SAM-dependent methyltransferase
MAANSTRQRLWLENKAFAASIPVGALVLDAGAGDAPYKSLLAHTRYESADFEQVGKAYAKSTYVCDLSAIPVKDGRFEAILFNQVMEHLPEPKLAIRELYRVLKPGGRMIFTAPLFYEEHEQPYDFYRYTQFAVRYLFTEAGFRIDRLDWLEGYYSTVAYQMNRMGRALPVKPAAVAPGALGYVLAGDAPEGDRPWLSQELSGDSVEAQFALNAPTERPQPPRPPASWIQSPRRYRLRPFSCMAFNTWSTMCRACAEIA